MPNSEQYNRWSLTRLLNRSIHLACFGSLSSGDVRIWNFLQVPAFAASLSTIRVGPDYTGLAFDDALPVPAHLSL